MCWPPGQERQGCQGCFEGKRLGDGAPSHRSHPSPGGREAGPRPLPSAQAPEPWMGNVGQGPGGGQRQGWVGVGLPGTRGGFLGEVAGGQESSLAS